MIPYKIPEIKFITIYPKKTFEKSKEWFEYLRIWTYNIA